MAEERAVQIRNMLGPLLLQSPEEELQKILSDKSKPPAPKPSAFHYM